jgi:hypothetical protein
LGKRADEPTSGGFARWKHIVIHCIRLEDDHTYREVVDRISLMSAVRNVRELDSNELRKQSTPRKAFDRFKMWVWQQLLRRSAKELPPLVTARSTERTSKEPVRPCTPGGGQIGRFSR